MSNNDEYMKLITTLSPKTKEVRSATPQKTDLSIYHLYLTKDLEKAKLRTQYLKQRLEKEKQLLVKEKQRLVKAKELSKLEIERLEKWRMRSNHHGGVGLRIKSPSSVLSQLSSYLSGLFGKSTNVKGKEKIA